MDGEFTYEVAFSCFELSPGLKTRASMSLSEQCVNGGGIPGDGVLPKSRSDLMNLAGSFKARNSKAMINRVA